MARGVGICSHPRLASVLPTVVCGAFPTPGAELSLSMLGASPAETYSVASLRTGPTPHGHLAPPLLHGQSTAAPSPWEAGSLGRHSRETRPLPSLLAASQAAIHAPLGHFCQLPSPPCACPHVPAHFPPTLLQSTLKGPLLSEAFLTTRPEVVVAKLQGPRWQLRRP